MMSFWFLVLNGTRAQYQDHCELLQVKSTTALRVQLLKAAEEISKQFLVKLHKIKGLVMIK